MTKWDAKRLEDYVAILQLKEESRKKGEKEEIRKKTIKNKCGVMLITIEFRVGIWSVLLPTFYF